MKTTCALETMDARTVLAGATTGSAAVRPREIVPLKEGAVASWQVRSHGLTFQVLRGAVWFTCESQPGDFLVAEGERITLEGRGKIVAQSLAGDANIAVVAA